MGAAFLNQLAAHRSPNAGSPQIQVEVIARSKTYIVAPKASGNEPRSGGISLSSWQTELAASTSGLLAPPDLLSILKQTPGPAILVDNTASSELPNSYPQFLQQGVSIVTANKKGFAGTQQLWDDIRAASLASGALIYHEASVGAGLPILSTLRDLLETGDTVQRIEGVLSGTMSYLFNQFAPVVSSTSTAPPQWSAAVKTAQSLGYTEPDPRDDLNGQDVARKCTILARLCGLQVQPGAFPVQSLIPEALASASSSQEFLDNLPAFDKHMAELKNKAAENGKALRFVASVDVPQNKLSVGLQEVDVAGPIAGLKGSDNIVSFTTARYSDSPLVVQGAGAGAEVTAMGVLADLLRVVREVK